MYRTAGYDWQASQEQQPNDRRDWEPGAAETEGLYVHSMPLCSQDPDCLAQDAVAPLDYPRCCYIQKWEGLPAYARAICSPSSAVGLLGRPLWLVWAAAAAAAAAMLA
eukprot:SAG22_NODE_5510_length_1002_cov_1.128461_2_plen_108_part_00